MNQSKIEIMSPVGSYESLQAAIQAGADAVYFGVGNLNMRSHSANNFAAEDLAEVCRICREAGIKSYLTLNIVLYNEDLEPMRETLRAAKAAGITAVIAFIIEIILLYYVLVCIPYPIIISFDLKFFCNILFFSVSLLLKAVHYRFIHGSLI